MMMKAILKLSAGQIDAGIRHIDTAELYADGKAEELVGKAIKPYTRRSLFIASKVRESKLEYESVLKSCDESLERLGIDCLDLYYIHKPNPEIPFKETARAFNKLLKTGKVKNIGISNASVKTMEEYASVLDSPFFAAQCHYNLIVREPEYAGVLDYCRKIEYISSPGGQFSCRLLSLIFMLYTNGASILYWMKWLINTI